MKRVTDLTIGTTYDATMTIANFAVKADGAVNIINLEDNTVAAAGDTKIAIVKKCTDPAGVAFLEYSNYIDVDKFSEHNFNLYSAALAKVVTLTAMPVPVAETIYVLYTVSRENENYMLLRKRYGVTAVLGETAISLADKFRVLINADTANTGIATDAAGAAIIVFTGTATAFNQAFQANFEIITGENLTSVVATTTAGTPDPGCGTNYIVGELEKVAKGYKGVLNRVLFANEMYNVIYSVGTANYDLTVVEHLRPFHTNTEGSVPFQVVTQVAMVSGTGAAFDAALALILV